MTKPDPLKSAAELAKLGSRYPNESAEYRAARTALLAEEIELRRHIERVAEQRRTLPPGGTPPEDYVFEGENGPVRLSGLFGDKQTLLTYNWMFGPQRELPCSMCTSLLSALDGEMPDILQRVAFVVIARAPLARMTAFAKERGWRYLKMASSGGNSFNTDYAHETADSGDLPATNVFSRRDGTVRHFWGVEMTAATADPGEDPRDAPEIMPIWNLLDLTPEGRGTDWYPELSYDQ